MKIRRNAGFLTILPVVLGGFSLNAVAATSIEPTLPTGKVYNFTADLNYSFSDLTLQISDLNNDYMGYMMDLSPYINQDVTSNFTEANSSISGQFTYNSSAQPTSIYISDTYNRTTYDASNESFTLNLSSENGETGQVFVGEGSSGYGSKSTTVATGTPSAPGTDYQNFRISSYSGTSPNVTLSNSSNFDCEFGPCGDGGSYFIQDYRPHDDPNLGVNGDLPEFFADIESFSFELFPSFGFDEPSSGDLTYQLAGVSMSLYFDGHDNLPTDNSLPDTLPTLAESRQANLSLSFNTDLSDTMYSNEVGIWDIQFTEDSPINDMLDENDYWDYHYNKEMQLQDFLNYSYLEGYADIGYTLTEFEALADGLTPDTPLLPDTDTNNTDDSIFEFTFDSNDTGFTFIDPFVAYGYDYEILTGTNFFTDVLLPVDFGVGNQFDLWLDNGSGVLADSGIDLTGGIAYNFTDPLGIDKFGIRGIDTDLLLDPNDPLAFITGLNFVVPGAPVNMSQTAVTVFVADTVPAPTTLILLMSGIIGFAVRQRKV